MEILLNYYKQNFEKFHLVMVSVDDCMGVSWDEEVLDNNLVHL